MLSLFNIDVIFKILVKIIRISTPKYPPLNILLLKWYNKTEQIAINLKYRISYLIFMLKPKLQLDPIYVHDIIKIELVHENITKLIKPIA